MERRYFLKALSLSLASAAGCCANVNVKPADKQEQKKVSSQETYQLRLTEIHHAQAPNRMFDSIILRT